MALCTFQDLIGAFKMRRRLSALSLKEKWMVLELVNQAEVKSYCERYIGSSSSETSKETSKERGNACAAPMWQMWYQGRNELPELVKVCVKSVARFSEGRECLLLDQHTLENYVSLPGYIHDKVRKEQISIAQLSEIVRVTLLAAHGGTWLDATVLLTDPIPSGISGIPFFCFSSTPEIWPGTPNFIRASSWYIHSVPGHIILRRLQQSLLEYWRHEQKQKHYFLTNIMIGKIIEVDRECRKAWEQMPFYSNVPPHVLQMQLSSPFNEDRFVEIKQMTTIHKLTRHAGVDFDPVRRGTFYQYLTQEFPSGL
jgi:hypothetical protein